MLGVLGRYGARSDETIVRGGALKKPFVLSKVIEQDGSYYVQVVPKGFKLRRFMLPPGDGYAKVVGDLVDMIRTEAFAEYAKKLDAFDETSAKVVETGSSSDRAPPVDKAAAMGLDESSEEAAPVRLWTPRKRRATLRLREQAVPMAFDIVIDLSGSKYIFAVAVQTRMFKAGRRKPALIAVSEQNLKNLREASLRQVGLAAQETQEGAVAAMGSKRSPKASPRAPRTTAAGREYFQPHRRRWIIVPPSGAKKPRVLTRKQTDEASPAVIGSRPAIGASSVVSASGHGLSETSCEGPASQTSPAMAVDDS